MFSVHDLEECERLILDEVKRLKLSYSILPLLSTWVELKKAERDLRDVTVELGNRGRNVFIRLWKWLLK